jgi:tyrosine-specific transport protein
MLLHKNRAAGLKEPVAMSVAVSRTAGAALLVAGTAIGAGMLALPVATGLGGFLPACVLYLLCWLFMAGTGLLFLEICLWLPKDANMVSMAYHLLGPWGRVASWALYLFLFYCLSIAYVAGGGGFVEALGEGWLSKEVSVLLFVCVLAPVVYAGTKTVDLANWMLMVGLVASYLGFVALSWGRADPTRLPPAQWGPALLALPIIFTSFAYQGVIPSLTTYLGRNPRTIRAAILIGSAVPFIAYVVWEYLILGIVPLDGAHGLLAAQEEGGTAIHPLKYFIESPMIYVIGQAFSFFALTTSFLGVALGLFDFLADGFRVAKRGAHKIGLALLVFVPPTLIVLYNPNIFLKALSYAGGIGCALLLGLLPIVMVWVGRYRRGYGLQAEQLKGGKVVLVLLFLFVLLELAVELMNELRPILQ